jgi:phage shock protein A
MLKRIHKILQQDDDPPNRVEDTIEAIKSAITEIENQLLSVSTTTQSHSTKIEALASQQKELEKKAKKDYLSNNHQQAKTYWKESKLYEQQIQKYQILHQAASTTKAKLIEKKSELEYKSDQILAQISLGAINANASQLHADIMEHLMLLGNDDELTQYKEQTTVADSRVQAIREINDEALGLHAETPAFDHLEELSKAIISDQKKEIESNLDKARIQHKSFFAKTEEKVDNQECARKKALLNSLLTSSGDHKKNKAAAFFKEHESQKTSLENQDRIKNFFGED